jgi:tRNA C32,U32 (ribose-2'-O)-methylase TrmJ
MNKLNKIFQKNQVLTAAELNAISNKIDEIINALSSYDDSDIREALEDLQDAIDRANATANEERERLDGVINNINDTVE